MNAIPRKEFIDAWKESKTTDTKHLAHSLNQTRQEVTKSREHVQPISPQAPTPFGSKG